MDLTADSGLGDFFSGSNFDKNNISSDWNRFYEEGACAE